MQESTVTAKGQTTLPKDVRTALSIKPGDKLRYILLGGEVRILKVQTVRSLQGVLKRPRQVPVSLSAMEEAIAKGATDAPE